MKGPNRRQLILLFLILLGTVWRLYGIASAWNGFDENVTLNLGQADWFTFKRIMLVREMNMVGYYGLVRMWLTLDPDLSRNTLVFVRYLSVIFSIATIPVLYAIGKKLFNENVGLLAAGLLAINQFHVKYAQNARSYSMFVFLVTLATFLLVRNLKSLNPKWTGYVCVSVLAVYSHIFAFFFLLAHLIMIALMGLRPKWIHLVTLSAGILPMALWVSTHHSVPTLNWVRPTTARSVVDALVLFVGSNGVFLLCIVAGAVLVAYTGNPRESIKLLSVWAFIPVVLTVLVSFAQPCFSPRFLIPCMPATTLLTAVGIERIKLLYAAVLLALIVFGMAMGTQPIGA